MTFGSDLPTILFSIETAARELDSKLVMAAALAQRGCRVIVGHKEIVGEIARHSQRVVWQGKSVFSVRTEDHLADRLLANGSVIMFMSDEGAMHQADSWVEQTLQKHWVDQFRTRHVGRLCVWGARQRDVIADYSPTLQEAIAVTGSARFDLCLPRYAWITDEQHHDGVVDGEAFILVCTRFGALAHTKGMGAFFSKLNPKHWPLQIDLRNVTDLWFKKWRQDAHDFAEFVMLIKELAAPRPETTVVIRPHPSESLDFYRQAFVTLTNVQVRREGNILGWIRPAKLIVHSNCTSGIEAVLAGRPVVNFMPSGCDRTGLDVEVAREAGATVGSISDALDRADRLLAGEAFDHVWSEHARSMLHNLTQDAVPLLGDETIATLKAERLDSSKVVLPSDDGFRRTLRRVLRERPEEKYVASKRGRLTSGHVEMILEGCRTHGIGAGRVRHMTERCTVIDPT